jgi:membrane protein implicated in regulation of membrane protease activity
MKKIFTKTCLSMIFAAVLLIPSLSGACSVCLTGANDASADAFNWSVLFLMATPYSVVGAIAGWLFYRSRRAAKQQRGEVRTPREERSPGWIRLAISHKEIGR